MPSSSKPSNDLSTALSVNCEGFASRVNIPQSTIQAIWSKAETLLKADGSIVSAPGMESCWYVESSPKKVSHLVSVTQKGTISCDKACEHYRSIGICSHVVAIAEKVGSLKEFAQFFSRKKELCFQILVTLLLQVYLQVEIGKALFLLVNVTQKPTLAYYLMFH